MSGRELVEVYRAKDTPQAHMLVSALEGAGIGAVVEGDHLQSALGELPLGWSSAPRVMVESRDLAKAREVIARAEATRAAAPVRSAEAEAGETCLACGAQMTRDDDQCPACGWSYKKS
jgi:hypothetical protein